MENSITIDMIDDWAGAAMQGLMTSRGQSKDIDLQEIASIAYDLAREMAVARGAFIEAHQNDLDEPDTYDDDSDDHDEH